MNFDPVYGFPLDLTTRKVFVALVNAWRSNPNGDPDNGGAPRQDMHGHGIISCACWKRMLRDYAHETCKQPLYFERDADLKAVMAEYKKPGKATDKEYDTDRMVAHMWDLPMFGGVLAEARRGVTGCLQFGDMRSVEPIVIEPMPWTSTTHRGQEKTKKVEGEIVTEAKEGANMGRYDVVGHAVYRGEGTFEPRLALANGATEAHLAIAYQALVEGFNGRVSAHRTDVTMRRLYVFDCPNGRGVEPPHVTRARVQVNLDRDTVGTTPKFEDYTVTVNDQLPAGMKLYCWEDGMAKLMAAK